MINKEQLFSQLEITGETQVRENLAQGIYAPKEKIDLINEWLRQQEERRINEATLRAEAAASRAEAATSEQIRLTRSATRAAWIAAIAAIITIIVEIIIKK